MNRLEAAKLALEIRARIQYWSNDAPDAYVYVVDHSKHTNRGDDCKVVISAEMHIVHIDQYLQGIDGWYVMCQDDVVSFHICERQSEPKI